MLKRTFFCGSVHCVESGSPSVSPIAMFEFILSLMLYCLPALLSFALVSSGAESTFKWLVESIDFDIIVCMSRRGALTLSVSVSMASGDCV
jgi:hypothetical protein